MFAKELLAVIIGLVEVLLAMEPATVVVALLKNVSVVIGVLLAVNVLMLVVAKALELAPQLQRLLQGLAPVLAITVPVLLVAVLLFITATVYQMESVLS